MPCHGFDVVPGAEVVHTKCTAIARPGAIQGQKQNGNGDNPRTKSPFLLPSAQPTNSTTYNKSKL